VSGPVVLLHGLSASTQWWRSTVEALEPDYDVHVLRLGGMPYAEAAAWLGDWLVRETDDGATLVGHSMGGAVALLAAAQNRDVVRRLALIAPAGLFATRRRLNYVAPLVRSLGARPGRIGPAAWDTARIGPLRLWRVAADLLACDLTPVLGSVHVPTLLVWGADDRLLPPSLAQEFHAQLPNSRLVFLENCGHVPMLEAPEALNVELRRFLEERA
jgi:pimeloyl-ACP methyl ester carboxylesterase